MVVVVREYQGIAGIFVPHILLELTLRIDSAASRFPRVLIEGEEPLVQ